MFEKSSFIKASGTLEKKFLGVNHAPIFRKKFDAKCKEKATLSICGLGIGYCYINGKCVYDDKFIAPVSNYDKTLWYNVYDVTDFIYKGENVIAVWCGNGFYNEDFPSSWGYDEAAWRDVPKFILQLEIGDRIAVVSDSTWKCKEDSAIWYNNLRSGEYFDAREYEENWNWLDYDDESWNYAIHDNAPPKGVFRKCLCEPIREMEVLEANNIKKTDENTYVYDFGQNISGYVRIEVVGTSGQELTIRYAEQLKDDGSLELNKMYLHYPMSEIQTDKLICSGRKIVWSPKFTYHGFQYIQISGLQSEKQAEVKAVFVHQEVKYRTELECSNKFFNDLFRAGQISTLSNMFYQMTDCPSREKLGWMNDAQASMEQILTDFEAEKVLEKWLQDIKDAMREDGALPGIVPTSGWGFHWGNGPVSDGNLFELPYRIYLHTGNAKPLIEAYPYFIRYLSYLKAKENDDGMVTFGLCDWLKPGFDPEALEQQVPVEFINEVLIREFVRITIVSAKLQGLPLDFFEKELNERTKRIIKFWIAADGKCKIHAQTAVAMLIYYKLYEELEPLKSQLMELIEENHYHHDCGMVGIRRLYYALNQCDLQEYAYRIINAKGYPAYREWFEQGANTLWEKWDCELRDDSKNHHMYSDFMSWMIKTILGIEQDEASVGFSKVHVNPKFLKDLVYARGCYNTVNGKIKVSWERCDAKIKLCIEVPANMELYHGEKKLDEGVYSFCYSE